MMTAEPDYRWDGDRWWRWSKGRWAPVSAADPQPRLVDVRPSPDHADVELVASWMRFRGGTKRALRMLPTVLASDEGVEFVLAADHNGNPGVLVLTSGRVLFLTNNRAPSLEFSTPAMEVLSAAVTAGRLRHPVIIQTQQTVAEFSCVDAAAAEALVGLLTLRSSGQFLTTLAPGGAVLPQQVRLDQGSAAPSSIRVGAAAPSAAHGQDSVAALQDLTRMFELGLVTREEFDAKKTEILDRL